MRRSVTTLLVALYSLSLFTGCGGGGTAGPSIPTVPDSAKIRSVTLDARHSPTANLLPHLRELGVTHITLIPFGFQRRADYPHIRMHTDGGWYSESDAGIQALARQARTHGLGLILKPHIWVGDYDTDDQRRSAIAFTDETGWQQWEASYRSFLLHYARLADTTDADVLVIGTELEAAVAARPVFWRTLIDTVRAVYDGRLTYAANWYDGYERVPFWDALDFVGVQAYFPITEETNPSLATMHAGWAAHRTALRRVAAEAERPVLFTEIGYRSVAYAAATPWTWPRHDEANSPDANLQARLYRAFFEAMMPAPWFAGAMLWKWHPTEEGHRPLGFTPQGKPAEQVIRRGFSARRP